MSSSDCFRRLSGSSRKKKLFLPNEASLNQGKLKTTFTQIISDLHRLTDYTSAEKEIHFLIHCLSLLLLNKEKRSEKFSDNFSLDIPQKRKRKHCQRQHDKSSECTLKQPRLVCLSLDAEGATTTEKFKQEKAKSRRREKVTSGLFKPLSSANLNENNDNSKLLDSAKSEFSDGSRQESSIIPENNKRSSFSSSNSYSKKPIHFNGSSFNTNPHRHLESPASPSTEHTPVGLDKLVKETSHKRRFCESIPPLIKSTNLKDTSSSNKELFLKDQFSTEALISPPRRIPRLLRRTQSAFCQARDLVEATQIGAPPFPPCYRRFNSCTASLDPTACPNTDIADFIEFQFLPKTKPSPGTPGGSAALHLLSLDKQQLKLNCNTNAAPHQQEFTPVKAVAPCQNLGIRKNNSSIFPSLLEKNLLASKHFQPCDKCDATNAKIKPEQLFSSKNTFNNTSTGIQKITRKLSSSFDSLPRVYSSRSREPKSVCIKAASIEKLETAASELNLCRKRLLKNGRKLFDSSREHNKLDRDIAASVQCLCRISTVEHKCKLCGVHSSPEKDLIKTIETKSAFKRSYNLDNRIRYFSQNQISEEKTKQHTKLTSPFDSQCQENLFQACLSGGHFSPVQKHFHHSSTNNRNIPDRPSLRSERTRTEEVDCFRSLCLGVGDFSSLDLGHTQSFSKQQLNTGNETLLRKKNFGSFAPVRIDMGCIQSVSHKKRVEPCRNGIIADVRATIDQSPTYIEEQSPIVLRYRTPYFRAHAQVIMPPIRNKETWTVGWIQACDFMRFINEYGDLGCSSWEIPALKSGKISAVSDSDGVSYPWYGNTTEIATIVGPTDSYRRMNLTMNDNFYPSVTWDVPVSEGTNAHLTRIVRNQSFITWLAAVNETTKEIFVLKTVRWRFNLEIDIDPQKELGRRANIVSAPIQQQPLVSNGPCEVNLINNSAKSRRRGVVTDNNSNSNYVGQIPITALVRPSANNAQTLIWRPTDNQEVVVVPAKEEHRDSNELVFFNGCSAMHGKESIVKEVSKQELIRLQRLTR